MRPRPTLILELLLVVTLIASSIGCKVTGEDIETWKGTVKGPGKIVAVMLSDSYPLELRTQAALALVEMERQDVDGVAELQRAIQQLDAPTRGQVIEGMATGLEAAMRGGDTAPADPNAGPPDAQIRAKDAAYLLITHAEGATRERLITTVVGWYVADFNGRSLSGNYSAEQIIRSLGAPAAEMLVDGMNAQMPEPALVKLAELIAQLGNDDTKERAAARLVELEQHMESDEFLDWLRARIVDSIHEQSPGADVGQGRVDSIAKPRQEQFITSGALPAMKHLASQDVVAERLLAIATTNDSTPAMIERRQTALQALEGNAKESHLDRLLELALSDAHPIAVRDYAFDRVGDIRSARAIPRMWPLVEAGADDAQRVRWRAGEMVLAIGGPAVVAEFFTKLPGGPDVKYEPEELEGYATRMAQMNPAPTSMVRNQLNSPNWWNRIIALRYFERKGTESDVAAMRRLVRDTAAVKGERWEGMTLADVGDVATQAIEALQARLTGGEAQNTQGATDGAGSE